MDKDMDKDQGKAPEIKEEALEAEGKAPPAKDKALETKSETLPAKEKSPETKKEAPPAKEKKRLSRVAKAIIGGLAAVVVVSAVLIGDYFYRISHDPAALFNTPAPTVTSAAPEKSPTVLPATKEPTPTPTPTPDPYEMLQAQADISMMKDIVNILIIGVDYAEERDTWGGKHAYHSDVMIVLAVNFKENTVNMISLPRDTYAKIPGVSGIYKLNAAIDCGGGYPEGLSKVAEAATWMLGGIPVDYYYAVTMPVVKELVDAIGGVEYDVDLNFTMMGRSYKKGMQLMDGQAVLDYFRVRKNVSEAGDLNRINRQKKLLVAIFRKMKAGNLLVTLPQFVKSFEGRMLTNTTLEQTAALAVFGYGLPEESIRMYSMDGPMRNIFNWNFCLTNQSKRVQIIKDVYGVDVPPYTEYSLDSCLKKWAQMRSSLYYSNAEKVIEAAQRWSPSYYERPEGAEEDPGGETPTAPVTPTAATAPDQVAPVQDMLTQPQEHPVSAQLARTQHALSNCRAAMKGSGKAADEAMSVLQKETTTLANMIGYGSLSWGVSLKNEIAVDFR